MKTLSQYKELLNQECSSYTSALQFAAKRFEWLFDGKDFEIKHVQTNNKEVIFEAICGKRRESTCVTRKVISRTFIPHYKYDHMSVAQAQDYRFRYHEDENRLHKEARHLPLSSYEEKSTKMGIKGYIVRSTVRFI